MMILISIFFMTNKACVIKWTLKFSSCLFETLKLICYLDVMNLFAIFHLDVNVETNELIYLVLLKVYYVKVLKDDCFVMLLLIMLNSLKICYGRVWIHILSFAFAFYFFSFLFFFFFFKLRFSGTWAITATVHALLMNNSRNFLTILPWTVHSCTVHGSYKLQFSVTFSLKMDLTVLFTHLKIILLQYFQFLVSTK